MLLVVVAAGPPAGAALDRGPGPGYFASDNVSWVTNIPIETDSPGARIVGKYLYITTARNLSIYDISTPESPQLTGFLPMPQVPQFAEEDVDTNGKILLIGTFGTLYVIDVEDKSNPTTIGEVATDAHTFSCVLNCRWAYGSDGQVVDLRDPTAPEEVGSWTEGMPVQGSHDVTEVAPGFVVTSSQPILLLDARKDPAHPKLLASGANKDGRFIHSNLWPRRMRDRFLLVGGESGGPFCENGAAFMTWDATKWRKTRTFTMIDEYRVTDGLPTDGNALVHTFCTHWFETHPKYRNGGLVAMAWYEHGTRFFDISSKGEIEEAGYFLPLGGSTSAAYWVNEEIVYAVDYQRGIDILRFAPPK